MRVIVSFCFLLSLMIVATSGIAQRPQHTQDPVPTLIPPTLVPQPAPPAEEELSATSAVARIAESGIVNVGILYNEPPFSELNIRGFVSGYDADIANSMANVWGVDTNFVQITRDPRQTASMLQQGTIDVVIAAQIHHRELDPYMEFSQTYHLSQKSVMVLTDNPAEALNDLASNRLGVVVATPAEESLRMWQERTGIAVEIQTYLTLDRAYRALVSGEINGLVDSEHHLLRVASANLEAIRILAEPIEVEPYAIGFLRQDASLRDMINRTLHHLTAIGRMDEIQQVHFPGEQYRLIRVWNNLPEEGPKPEDYPTQINYPSEYVLSRVQSGGVIRVAGVFGAGAGSPESELRLDAFHRRLIDEMVSRWGARVEYITATGEAALQLVASGEADIAVGIEPDWSWADRVEFTARYLLHGERLMVPQDSDVVGFTSLRGRVVIIPQNEPDAAGRLLDISRAVSATVEASPQREQDLAFTLLSDQELNARAVFGNSLRLVPLVQANDSLRLTNYPETTNSRWYGPSNLPGEDYSPRLMVMAVPENDTDFRLLVEYTMQEIAREGRLAEWLEPLMLSQDIPTFEIWPGTGLHLGFNLSR